MTHKEFKENGNIHLEKEDVRLRGGKTKCFALGIQMLQNLFCDIDFNKPFRLIVDYSPEQPNVFVKICSPNHQKK